MVVNSARFCRCSVFPEQSICSIGKGCIPAPQQDAHSIVIAPQRACNYYVSNPLCLLCQTIFSFFLVISLLITKVELMALMSVFFMKPVQPVEVKSSFREYGLIEEKLEILVFFNQHCFYKHFLKSR